LQCRKTKTVNQKLINKQMTQDNSTNNEVIDNEALLRALADNPEAAHFLADIVAGGDARQLAIEHFGLVDVRPAELPDEEATDTDTTDEPTESPTEVPPEPPKAEPRIGMFQSAPLLNNDVAEMQSEPTFLKNVRPKFWDLFEQINLN
jgi:hypothetical protein